MMGETSVIANVSRETRDRLEIYAATLLKWNKKINLVSRSSVAELWNRHIADSLQLLRLCPDGSAHWLDIGTGAGFPGLILAIAARDHAPGLRFTLVESDARKVAFLQVASRESGTPITIHCERAEHLPPMNADIISARALAPLTQLLELHHRHGAPGARGLYLKGRGHEQEIKRALESWRFEVHKHRSLTDPSGVILDIKGVARA